MRLKQWNRDGGTLDQSGWNNGKMIVDEWNIDCRTVMVEQWNSRTEMVEE